MSRQKLKDWGWSDHLTNITKDYITNGLEVGRIIKESKHIYSIVTPNGVFTGTVSGHFMYTAVLKSDYPTIGDWVAVKVVDDRAVIEKLIPRLTSFSRKRPGNELEEQVIVANIDYIFLVFALDGTRNYSAGAVERFLTRAWDSGATPVIILNKIDLCKNFEEYYLEVEQLAPGVTIYLTSAKNGDGITELKSYFSIGKTIGFTGFSGVGKSALINRICGEQVMKTGTVRKGDLKGKHTTTHKELIMLKDGGILIDSPGLKELQLWGDEDSIANSYSDITTLSADCKFSDCQHSGEPGCAVLEALDKGELDSRRYENYLKMKKELKYLADRESMTSESIEKAKWRDIKVAYKKQFK